MRKHKTKQKTSIISLICGINVAKSAEYFIDVQEPLEFALGYVTFIIVGTGLIMLLCGKDKYSINSIPKQESECEIPADEISVFYTDSNNCNSNNTYKKVKK